MSKEQNKQKTLLIQTPMKMNVKDILYDLTFLQGDAFTAHKLHPPESR